jgi:hypothetical protein
VFHPWSRKPPDSAAAGNGDGLRNGFWRRGALDGRKTNNRKVQSMKTLVNKLLKGRISQSISNSTRSLPGRWTKVTTMGCILALVFLGAMSAQPKAAGTARPFKVTGIFTSVPDASGMAGTWQAVGNATHLGQMVLSGPWKITGGDFVGFTTLTFHVSGTYKAANGDTLDIDIPEWVIDYTVTPPVGTGLAEIKGGTGRFAHASGSYAAVIVYGDTSALTGELTGKGTISY